MSWRHTDNSVNEHAYVSFYSTSLRTGVGASVVSAFIALKVVADVTGRRAH